jgi:outer membrane protein assembly factor BamB
MRVMKGGGLVLLLMAAAVGVLYVFGVRLALDGSGTRPRFVSTSPDYDALEADRARQRERIPPPVKESGSDPDSAPKSGSDPGDEPTQGIDTARNQGLTPIGGTPISWPDFRGPNRDGRYTDAIRTEWPTEGLPRLWKQPVGLGYASFVVAGRRAFTIEQRRQQEIVSAFDVESGRELWTHGWDGGFVETMGGDGPRATPTYHEGRIYALGALGELRCLDAATGALVWRHNILTENGARNLDWGMSASPLIVDDNVIVLPGGPAGKSVVAYDKRSGAVVWHALDDQQAYTSPMLVTLAGTRQILAVSASRVMGLTAGEGRLLWEYPWVTNMGINVAQPVILGADRIFLSAGYDHGAAVIELTREGPPSLAQSTASSGVTGITPRLVWENRRMKNKFTTSVLHGAYLYGLDESILACIDAATGDLKWKGGRYGYGQVLLAGDHLIVLTEDGELVLVRATPDRHEEIARFQAIEGKTWNHPIITSGRLLVRNVREMAAFDIRP